ncbi:DUF222 domain-containing protein [Amycolatopsis tolypomycina]|uniref:DUF222 domain-containing protein n=1 Tax=Amycolatopsis tolypomycina TaxID=208445 RepID=UPI000A6621A1|nr:DUF222 domain-containing protein [Amycolatopsis tolypomycina]
MELFGYRSAARLLEHLAGEPKPTAERLMKRARLVNPGRNLDGSRIPALAPATGVAARAGRLSNPMIDVITDVLNQVPPEHRLSAETNLLTFAEQAGHKQVAALGTRILAHLVPDGPAPDDTEPVAPSRELFLRRSSTGAENPDATTSTNHSHLQPEHGKSPQPHGYGAAPTRSPQATH